MDNKTILAAVDHTLLTQTATWEEIRQICDDGAAYGCASVCIPASFVKQAAEYLGDRLPVCTVIGFPNGYSTTAVKVFEAKDGRWDDLLTEIKAVKGACGELVLKVIIETCLLTDEEKVKLCQIVSDSGADYIKTSTGFSTAGATREDVALFKANVAPHVKIKAAGGISSLQDAADFLALGADRLGTSRIVKLVKGQAAQGY